MKRSKNDAVDAEAICEAVQRPGMRFVAVKSEDQQAAGLVFRTRDLILRQRTQLINAIRGHLAEYGWVAPRGTAHMTMLAELSRGWPDHLDPARSRTADVPTDGATPR